MKSYQIQQICSFFFAVPWLMAKQQNPMIPFTIYKTLLFYILVIGSLLCSTLLYNHHHTKTLCSRVKCSRRTYSKCDQSTDRPTNQPTDRRIVDICYRCRTEINRFGQVQQLVTNIRQESQLVESYSMLANAIQMKYWRQIVI